MHNGFFETSDYITLPANTYNSNIFLELCFTPVYNTLLYAQFTFPGTYVGDICGVNGLSYPARINMGCFVFQIIFVLER